LKEVAAGEVLVEHLANVFEFVLFGHLEWGFVLIVDD